MRCEKDGTGRSPTLIGTMLNVFAISTAMTSQSNNKNAIAHFGWYWAMEDGSANATAVNERNCTYNKCSWDHATCDFVQNSWKHPSPGNASVWDASDVLQLASVNVRSVVSVTHLFTSGPSGALWPDYATRWTTYLAQMKAAGALQHVAYWYPSDEPDLRMPADSLNKILAAVKSQSPAVPVLLTLSNLAFNETTKTLNYNVDTTHLQASDVLTFDIYSGGSCTWGAMEAKLDVLANFTAAHGIAMAVIPDATSGTYAALGAVGNNVLNDQFYLYCAARPNCRGLFPFIGGTWQDIVTQRSPEVLASFNAIADAAKSGDFSKTIVDPPVVCDKGDLFHMPCLSAGGGASNYAPPQQCNAIARSVFGYATGNRSATQAILPARMISMVVGDVWSYEKVCREIIGVPGTVECEGDSVACWLGVLGWKSKVVSCSGDDVRHYEDVCSAHAPNGSAAVNRDWTCCVRIQTPTVRLDLGVTNLI